MQRFNRRAHTYHERKRNKDPESGAEKQEVIAMEIQHHTLSSASAVWTGEGLTPASGRMLQTL